MVLGIGTDIVEIERVQQAIKSRRFLEKCFTPNEILLFHKTTANTAAGSFAAKEAVAKALGTGFRGFGVRDIEILRNEAGKPYVNLYLGAADLARSLGAVHMHITISHCIKYAVAYAIAEGGAL